MVFKTLINARLIQSLLHALVPNLTWDRAMSGIQDMSSRILPASNYVPRNTPLLIRRLQGSEYMFSQHPLGSCDVTLQLEYSLEPWMKWVSALRHLARFFFKPQIPLKKKAHARSREANRDGRPKMEWSWLSKLGSRSSCKARNTVDSSNWIQTQGLFFTVKVWKSENQVSKKKKRQGQ
jgi:hypothetical protein